MKEFRIGIVLPAYNEGAVISSVLNGIPSSMEVNGNHYRLTPVVVDDGSTDKTYRLAKSNKRTHVIEHLVNSGAGAATRSGLRYLRENDFDFGATMDADGQHSPKDLEKVLRAAINGKGDLIIGNRLLDTAGMPWYKVVGNKGLNYFTRVIVGVKSSDSQSGLKGFNRKTIDKLEYRENGYAFCSELLWRADRAGLKIVDVPIKAIYTDYSKSKGQSNWTAFHTIRQLIKQRLMGFFR